VRQVRKNKKPGQRLELLARDWPRRPVTPREEEIQELSLEEGPRNASKQLRVSCAMASLSRTKGDLVQERIMKWCQRGAF
jgi:hypothetical protein